MKFNDYSLSDIGFTSKEARVYSTLLELGQGTIFEISKRARLNRTTVYPIVYKMMQEGLIKKMMKGKKRCFFVEDVRDLRKNIQEKEHILDKLLPQLEALHNILPNKPRIIYFEGAKGIRDFYSHILENLSPGDTILDYIGDMRINEEAINEFAVKDYPKERLKRKIPIKCIAIPSAAASEWKKVASQYLREIKIVGDSGAPFSANLQIYKNGIGLI
jgi:sugar-specific transcriptional regulator TrmB